ncbi:glycosyltransferase [Seongchinamella unica]|uniref:Glycosyltransferase n=1 Tax=Seongchinamella unica TaxID=2547392 RepID=A0A4R5LQG3_9GAMM|nr:glycosyltransferase [Seongchinamella unica]TDG12761.1 glycosyltransferase [Seongchinamella unica]
MKRIAPQGLSGPVTGEVALVVVTYCPGERLVRNMQVAADQFERVFLVDNTVGGESILENLDEQKFEIILNHQNLGLGDALNTGCRRAMESGYEWAVTLDQDTELLTGFLGGMLAAWSASPVPAVVLGSNYYNASRGVSRFPESVMPEAIEQTTVITSGSLMHLPTWCSLGMFREDYFIDSIDHEFCLRVRRAGYAVAVNCQLGMRQYIGEDSGHSGYISRFLPYRHSEWRKYTGARNSIRTLMDYACREPSWGLKKFLGLCTDFIAILFLEPNKGARLRAFFLGLAHGLQGRLGSVPEQVKNFSVDS